MLRFLLQRPIAVIMCFIAAAVISTIAFFNLPISLLPAIDVPEITIAIRYPNGSPEEIEQNILKPIRENIITLSGIKDCESIAQNESGKINLRFEFGTPMDLAYIEANEKIDRLTPQLPPDLERPTVIKSSTTDLPIIRLQIIPKNSSELLAVSELSNKVLKRRLEQLNGVGLVDINGLQSKLIRIVPDYRTLKSLQLTDMDIAKVIESSNLELGSVSVKDGNYRYYLKLSSKVSTPDEVGELPILLKDGKGSVKLNKVAAVFYEAERPSGFHLFGSDQGIVITIHKQAAAKMTELIPDIHKVTNQFKKEYPNIDFELTQDQSLLLMLSIQNLSQSLIWGGAFAFAVLFLFMRGWREPLIMGIVLPVSLILAFSLFYLFDISLNIISLSGLALGLGMLVDNSIVVIDNIMLKRNGGLSLLNSAVAGTQEVIVPLFSSALTNLAVFLPLIFMSGITGALFFDQAISIASILSVSILCTFILIPLLYVLLFRKRPLEEKSDSRFFIGMKNIYERSFLLMWQNKKLCMFLMCLTIPVGVWLLWNIPREGFPKIERTETLITIEWNEPIDVFESRRRITEVLKTNEKFTKISEAELGQQQFLLNSESYTAQQLTLYFQFADRIMKEKSDNSIGKFLKKKYPLASVSIKPAPNAFEQLFSSNRPFYEVRYRDSRTSKPIEGPQIDSLISLVERENNAKVGKGFKKETMVFIHIDFNKLKIYHLNYDDVIKQLKIAFGEYRITDFKNFGEVTPVVFDQHLGDIEKALQNLEVYSSEGTSYAVKDFLSFEFKESYKSITADAIGIYQSIEVDKITNEQELETLLSSEAQTRSLTVDFSGEWFDSKDNLQKLTLILLVSMLLMYFILTAEFESLKQPLLVMLTFPLGLTGSLALLWIAGGTLNIMSGIGIVVVLGILDNDAILKIDRINRLKDSMPLEQAIRQAGLDRLKPIVMNTCTNVLAITPIIFSNGIGADLQRPVALTTIGGLIVGTFTALYFVPLLYWFSSKKIDKIVHCRINLPNQ